MGKIAFLFHGGKNRKFPYYLRNVLRYQCPSMLYRRALSALLEEIESRSGAACIKERIDYDSRLA